YGLNIAEGALAAGMPSSAARAAGVFYPLVDSVAKASGSDPANGTEKKTGAFLIQSSFQATGNSSSLWLYGAAQNLLALRLAAQLGYVVQNPFMAWLKASCVPALVAMALTPLVAYWAIKPEVTKTPEAPKEAERKLKEMGPVSRDEAILAAVIGGMLVLWAGSTAFGIPSVNTAVLGLTVLLFTGVLTWDDCAGEKGAWTTMTWFAILVSMSAMLNKLGIVTWLAASISAKISAAGLSGGRRLSFARIRESELYTARTFPRGQMGGFCSTDPQFKRLEQLEQFLGLLQFQSSISFAAPQPERLHDEDSEVLGPPIPVPQASLLLWCLFGASGWWSSNAISAELPLYVSLLPEAQQVGMLISVATQLGNIFPILYKVLQPHLNIEVRRLIHCMQVLALVSLLATAALWDEQTLGRSLPLLGLTFVTGGVGCMTDVTFWSYAMAFPARCTKAISVGMTLGGLMLNLLSVLQMGGRSAKDPRFSPQTFFLISALLQGVWWLVVCYVEGGLPWAIWSLRVGLWHVVGRPQGLTKPLLSSEPGAAGSGAAGGAADFDSQHAINSLPLTADTSFSAHQAESCDLPAAWELHPWAATGLQMGCFIVYGAVYTLPTLLPFVA
ncbi:unnamed protein product, partial [Polarella glacialis]